MAATREAGRSRWRWVVPLGLAPVLLVLAGWLYFRFALSGPYDGRDARPFDRQAWLVASEDPRGARFLMVADLLDRGLLEGLTLEQAGELLGPPSETPHFASVGPCWYLGPEPGSLSIDSAWLLLELEGGRVLGGRVVTD